MIDYFHVLDLTVSKWVKDFMKQKFNEWFTTQLRNELESGKELENITINFLLSTMKPLQCNQSVKFITRKKTILAGWRASGISAAVANGLIGFFIDPFIEIDPFEQTIEISMTPIIIFISFLILIILLSLLLLN